MLVKNEVLANIFLKIDNILKYIAQNNVLWENCLSWKDYFLLPTTNVYLQFLFFMLFQIYEFLV